MLIILRVMSCISLVDGVRCVNSVIKKHRAAANWIPTP